MLDNQLKTVYFFPILSPKKSGKMATSGLTQRVFQQALSSLNDMLVEIDMRFTFLCVGGGALMALGGRKETHDLDGVLEPTDPVSTAILQQLAMDVAEEFTHTGKASIPDNWINCSVGHILRAKGYSRAQFESRPGYSWSNLEVKFASPEYLLAMKCFASRQGKQDFNDIVFLIKQIGVKTFEELQAIVVDNGYEIVVDPNLLRLSLAWAWPGDTEYDELRLRALNRYREVKNQQMLRPAA